jgi:tetraacyldisaccharide 4'-kinase
LRRADAVLLSRADMIRPAEREAIHRRVAAVAPNALWGEIRHAPQDFVSASGEQIALDSLPPGRIAAFCGLGNPAGFRHTLKDCGCDIAAFREFPDHHPYSRADIESLARWVEDLNVAAIVCSQKDLVKINLPRLGSKPLLAVCVAIEFLSGQEDFDKHLCHFA